MSLPRGTRPPVEPPPSRPRGVAPAEPVPPSRPRGWVEPVSPSVEKAAPVVEEAVAPAPILEKESAEVAVETPAPVVEETVVEAAPVVEEAVVEEAPALKEETVEVKETPALSSSSEAEAQSNKKTSPATSAGFSKSSKRKG